VKMDLEFLNLDLVKEIILIISGVGTFISALIALFTIREVKKQRLSSYKPELILDSFVSSFYADGFMTDDDNLRYKTTKYLENNQKELKESKKGIYMHYLLQNIGFGTSKYIIGKWSFNYKKAGKALSKYLPSDCAIHFDKDGFFIKNAVTDNYLFFRRADLYDDTIDYILPESQGDNGKGQAIPGIITDVYSYYLVFKYSLKVGYSDEHIYDEFPELPKPELKVSYKDFNNKTYYKKFELSFKFAGNNVEKPDNDKNDCGMFYIDIVEK
jgi:hypothetical protein